MRTFCQECLSHVIIIDERRLRWLLQQYLAYYGTTTLRVHIRA